MNNFALNNLKKLKSVKDVDFLGQTSVIKISTSLRGYTRSTSFNINRGSIDCISVVSLLIDDLTVSKVNGETNINFKVGIDSYSVSHKNKIEAFHECLLKLGEILK
jgi:hypothetical protein